MKSKKETLDAIKEREKEYHDEFHDGGPLEPVNVEEYRRRRLSPCYTTGSDHYSDNKEKFHRLIHSRGGWKDKVVLDYACGPAMWNGYYAMTGARKVCGFDIAHTAIRRTQECLRSSGLEDKVTVEAMDASSLEYPDNEFEVVIGHGVIHHVIKYDNIFSEMHRVMKPGAQAFFLEGLADFPLFKIWWQKKGEVPEGDVPIFAKDLREKASMFSKVEIVGDDFLFSLKRLLWKKNMGPLRRNFLRACRRTDEVLFSACPPLRRWGSFSYIILTK